ncbi:iron-sulfur cluster assembly scaffold protein [candidate division KSB1 bacterium]|nr:iron-sulfur cluster assembly scaffold protein [candidate division KSB1 bacterium]
MDHFNNPRNVGKLQDADGQARVGDPNCGDFIQVWIKVRDETITDFKYKVYGCGAAIATTSAVSEMVIGKKFAMAIQMTDDDVVTFLGGLPQGKRHCSLLGIQGLHTAMADYLIRRNHLAYNRRMERYAAAGLDLAAFHTRTADLVPAKAAQILHVGAGHGLLAIEMAKRGRSVLGIDVSAHAVHIAQLNAVHFKVDHVADFRQIDVFQADLAEQSFDTVICLSVLHRIAQTEKLLQTCKNLCKKNGVLLLGDWSAAALELLSQTNKENHPHTGWNPPGIKSWLQEHGFSVQEISDLNCWWLIAQEQS